MNEPTCLSCDEDCDYAGHPHPGRYACIKHPQARAYLNRSVIEKMSIMLYECGDNTTPYVEGYTDALIAIAALLRGYNE